jgi:hypothetical protein
VSGGFRLTLFFDQSVAFRQQKVLFQVLQEKTANGNHFHAVKKPPNIRMVCRKYFTMR